ncbi:NRDE-2, necessary for RNA interference-domain-containing protein [Entophlyctis helioformis]|nr:NRDE-2, necessary for RNA interference-domain-containing protein [Entophlyctis helioformis]
MNSIAPDDLEIAKQHAAADAADQQQTQQQLEQAPPATKTKRRRHRHGSASASSSSSHSSSSDTDGAARSKRTHTRPSKKPKSSKHKKHSKDSKDNKSRRSSKAARHAPDPDPVARLYTTDPRGDMNNLIYECIREMAVPVYKRFGDRIVGDTARAWRIKTIVRLGSRPVVVRDVPGRLADSSMTNKERNAAFKSTLRLRPVRMNAPSKNSANGATRPGKAAEIPGDFVRLLDEDLDDGQKAGDSGTGASGDAVDLSAFAQDLEFQAKTRDADRRIRKNPTDTGAWLALIELQDDLLNMNVLQSRRGAMANAICETKLSILEKALKQLPDDERLISLYMSCGAQLWESAILLAKWDDVLDDHPTSLVLWNQYLDYRQTKSASFSVTDCLDLYQECITMLQDPDYRNDDEDVKESEQREAILLHVFTRACAMLAQAGYTERAVASFQALIEFSCFCPGAFGRQTFVQRVGQFEMFWDSECARFGEPGAKGWERSLLDVDDTPQQLPPADDDMDGHADTRFSGWADRELSSQWRDWMPLRGSTDDTIVDPFRTVLMDDVRGLLFDIRLPQTKRALIYRFMRFLGAPFNAAQSSHDPLFQDQFLNDEFANDTRAAQFLRASQSKAGSETDAQTPHGSSHTASKRSIAFPLRVFPQSPWSLFGNGVDWMANFDAEDVSAVDALGYGRRAAIGTVLQQARLVLDQDTWLLPMLLAMEASAHPQGVDKMGKTLLKTDRMNLGLWNAYAQACVTAGKIDEARKVYLTALASYASFPKQHQAGSTLLFAMFADLEFGQGRSRAALCILVSAAEDAAVPADYATSEPSPTRLLKARKTLGQLVPQLFSSVDPFVYNDNMQRLMDVIYANTMLEYLSQGIDAAHALFNALVLRIQQQCQLAVRSAAASASASLPLASVPHTSGSLLEEYVWQAWTRLLFQHMNVSSGAYKPAMLREVLERAMLPSVSTTALATTAVAAEPGQGGVDRAFPSNSVFLVLYGWNEARMGIENRVRRFMDQVLSKYPSHVVFLFTVWCEIHQRSGANPFVIRSLFERALDSPRSVHSVSLWYLAIQFEIQAGEHAKAKALVYRGIRECPWSKDLYLMAFGALAPVFTESELADLYTVMEEKEIRIRRPVAPPDLE